MGFEKRWSILILAIALISVSATAFSIDTWCSASSRTVGVAIGDAFNYTSDFDYGPPFDPISLPLPFEFLNATESASLQIMNVSDTNVTIQSIWFLRSFGGGPPSNITYIGNIDVETGEGPIGSEPWVIAADLSANDTINSYGWIINETVARTYSDGPRETNHMYTSSWGNTTSDGNETDNFGLSDWYWDKSTGVMVESSTKLMIYQNDQLTWNVSWVLTISESSIWTIPEFTPTLFALIPPILLFGAVILRKRKLARVCSDDTRI